MTAAVVLLVALIRGGGFTLVPEGENIRVSPASSLTPELRRLILCHKDDLRGLLVTWLERASIMEYEGRVPRDQAETAALADVLRHLGCRKGGWRCRRAC